MKLPRVPYWPLLVVPMAIFGLGYFLNAAVIGLNHGQMPVLAPKGDCSLLELKDDLLHGCMDAHTRLKFLSDWVYQAKGGQLNDIASPGDFLEDLGDMLMWPFLWVWFAWIIKDRNG